MKLTVRRAAKINLGNYENTDIAVELEVDISNETAIPLETHFEHTLAEVNKLLRNAVDQVELGNVKAKSKAARFGV